MTEEERDNAIKFCEEVSEKYDFQQIDFSELTDEELKVAEFWYLDLIGLDVK